MTRKMAAVLAGGVLAIAGVAHAHPVTVDGATGEWLSRAPSGGNLGIVARDSMSRGELVWADPRMDARTDLSGGGPLCPSSRPHSSQCAIAPK